MKHALELTAEGDREIVMTRSFSAPRQLVFDAWTRPELLRRWLGVVGGWRLAECEIDLRVPGAFVYVWRGPGSPGEMGLRGTFREIVVPERIVTVGAFDEPWYPGGETNTLTLVEHRGETTLTNRVLYDSREARDMVLRSPMEQGLATGYDLLDEVLAALPGR
ncbi:MAG TPA: SRPBCC domain-containing protein [Kofleriaceae bacterium]|nr:SRPBCC domain-containing protein [Kofleriaceae bacterium]